MLFLLNFNRLNNRSMEECYHVFVWQLGGEEPLRYGTLEQASIL